MKLVLCLALMLVQSCFAQECTPEAHPEPNSAFSYVRAEIKGLRALRLAMAEERKIPAPAAPDDPQRVQKAETRNTIAKGLGKYYDCASRLVAPYKDSNNKRVRE